MRFRHHILILTIFSLILPFNIAIAASAPKPGTSCKQGQNFAINGLQYKCIKSGKKYVWDKGTRMQGPQTSTNSGVASNSSNNNSSGLRTGVPCDREMQEAPGALICLKVNGALIWQNNLNQQGNQGAGQGVNQNNNSGNNSGTTQLTMNADGTWQTLPGYPKDVAPPGNNGATWFQGNIDIYTAQPTYPVCTTTTPITQSPAQLSDIESIQGQGFMQTGAHNLPVAHMYWNTALSNESDSNGLKYVSKKVRVYAPADMTLRTYSKSNITKDGKQYSEYGLSFSLCGNYWVTWGHLDDLSQELIDASKTAAKHECMNGGQNYQSQDCYEEYISYRIKAGTFIGMSSGRAAGFDLGFYDTSKLNKNILDPHSFKGRITTGKCVMSYAVEPLKSQLMAKLIGDRNCGGVGNDIAGTISGVWLNPDHTTESVIEDYHIALAAHWSDSKLAVFAIGSRTSIPGLSPGVYTFTPNSSTNSNKPFASVKAGEVACYDHLSGWLEGHSVEVGSILVKSETGGTEKISIAGSSSACGSGPFSMPTNVATFQRKNVTS